MSDHYYPYKMALNEAVDRSGLQLQSIVQKAADTSHIGSDYLEPRVLYEMRRITNKGWHGGENVRAICEALDYPVEMLFSKGPVTAKEEKEKYEAIKELKTDIKESKRSNTLFKKIDDSDAEEDQKGKIKIVVEASVKGVSSIPKCAIQINTIKSSLNAINIPDECIKIIIELTEDLDDPNTKRDSSGNYLMQHVSDAFETDPDYASDTMPLSVLAALSVGLNLKPSDLVAPDSLEHSIICEIEKDVF